MIQEAVQKQLRIILKPVQGQAREKEPTPLGKENQKIEGEEPGRREGRDVHGKIYL